MLMRRRCTARASDGRACEMAPLRGRPFCFSHDPERAADVAEARRMGGLRRRKEGTLAVAYDLPGLDTAEGVRRVYEIALSDLGRPMRRRASGPEVSRANGPRRSGVRSSRQSCGSSSLCASTRSPRRCASATGSGRR